MKNFRLSILLMAAILLSIIFVPTPASASGSVSAAQSSISAADSPSAISGSQILGNFAVDKFTVKNTIFAESIEREDDIFNDVLIQRFAGIQARRILPKPVNQLQYQQSIFDVPLLASKNYTTRNCYRIFSERKQSRSPTLQ